MIPSLCEHAVLCLHIIDHGSERRDLAVLLIGVIPRSISHHVTMHIFQLLNDFRMERDILHDPRAFELINEGQNFLVGEVLSA